MFTQQNFKKYTVIIALIWGTGVTLANAQSAIKLLPTTYSKMANSRINMSKITQIVQKNFAVSNYHMVRAQIVGNKKNQPDHLLVYLYAKDKPLATLARINITPEYQVRNIVQNYHLQADDLTEQPPIATPTCPNDNIEFLIFFTGETSSLAEANKIAHIALSHGLKVKILFGAEATKQNFFNYAVSPNLKGIFYSGHGNVDLITTYDGGVITYKDIQQNLKGKWKHVTNIWPTCLAACDPMRTAVTEDAEAPNYAAGKTVLSSGSATYVATCALENVLNLTPLDTALYDAYSAYGYTQSGGRPVYWNVVSKEPFSYVKPEDGN